MGRPRLYLRWCMKVAKRISKLIRHPGRVNKASINTVLGLIKNYLFCIKWDFKYLFLPRTENWYKSLFKSPNHKAKGDISPVYCELPDEEVAKIAASFPDMKIIILFRNPVDQLWSKAKMNILKDHNRRFEDVSDEEFYNFFDRTHSAIPSYTALIDRWTKHFKPYNVHVNFYEKLDTDPYTFYNEICEFLDIDPELMDYRHLLGLPKIIHEGIKIDIPMKYNNYLSSLFSTCITDMQQRYKYAMFWGRETKEFNKTDIV